MTFLSAFDSGFDGVYMSNICVSISHCLYSVGILNARGGIIGPSHVLPLTEDWLCSNKLTSRNVGCF